MCGANKLSAQSSSPQRIAGGCAQCPIAASKPCGKPARAPWESGMHRDAGSTRSILCHFPLEEQEAGWRPHGPCVLSSAAIPVSLYTPLSCRCFCGQGLGCWCAGSYRLAPGAESCSGPRCGSPVLSRTILSEEMSWHMLPFIKFHSFLSIPESQTLDAVSKSCQKKVVAIALQFLGRR